MPQVSRNGSGDGAVKESAPSAMEITELRWNESKSRAIVFLDGERLAIKVERHLRAHEKVDRDARAWLEADNVDVRAAAVQAHRQRPVGLLRREGQRIERTVVPGEYPAVQRG